MMMICTASQYISTTRVVDTKLIGWTTQSKLCLGNMTAGSGPVMLALCFDLFFFVSFVFLGITENIML